MSRQLMRWSASLVGAVALFVGLAAPAGATAVPVSGSFSGTGTLVADTACPAGQGLGASTDSTGDLTALGPADIHLLVCLDQFLGTTYSVFGSFTITGGGGSISGAVGGTNDANRPLPGPWPFDLTLTVTSGTRAFEGATGSLHMVGDLRPLFTISGTLDGTITVPPPTPAAKDDCRNGGWHDVESDSGVPFRNQGECIAWVNHHT